MNRFKRFIAGTAMTAMLFTSAVFAEDTSWDCTIVPDFSESRLEVSGTAKSGETVTAMVLPQGKTPNDVWGLSAKKNTTSVGKTGTHTFDIPTVSANPEGVMFYVTQFKTEADGSFNLNMGIDESGVYDVYFLSSESGVYKYTDISFISSGDYENTIDSLNDNINSETEFVAMFEDEDFLTKLGFDKDIAEPTEVAEILFAELDGEKLGYDFEGNKSLYECCAGIVLINSGKEEEARDYILYAIKDDSDAMKWYDKYITDEKAEKELADKLNKGIENVDELADEIKAALILYVVENPDGYENIKAIFKDFSDITGEASPTSKSGVYSKLAGRAFGSIDELMDEYEDLCGSVSSGGSSGGGGGSSSGGRGAASGLEVFGSAQETVAEPMNKNIFDDLDSVPWATDAIVELAAKGVIAGKGDNKFCPEDMVTREEFTKLVAEAFVPEISGAEISFLDVPKDRWSYPFIAKAKAAGLINGYSETEFGATDLISRQDMAVIIYNTAVYKGVEVMKAEDALGFGDDGEIADYAKESVYALKAMGIVNGVSDMEFAPLRNATRAEAAVIIHKLLRK